MSYSITGTDISMTRGDTLKAPITLTKDGQEYIPQQGDQVYVYKLNSSSTWSVTVREAYTKIVAGTGLTSSYSGGKLTISLA